MGLMIIILMRWANAMIIPLIIIVAIVALIIIGLIMAQYP